MLRFISHAVTQSVTARESDTTSPHTVLPPIAIPLSRPNTPPTARISPAVRTRYIPGLDGLRALAVIAVLLYHADMPWAAGGFLGVDVFFVLSGYLITALLHIEWARHERVNLAAFWGRRARRLLPALFVVLTGVLIFAVVFLHDEVAGLRAGTLAALVYATNWYLIYGHQSYFASVGRPSPLQHLWSLAVEEQFYLVWPLLFVLGMRMIRQRGLLLLTLVGAGVSTILMASRYSPHSDPSRLYYGSDTHATALLLGAALALFLGATDRNSGRDSRRTARIRLAISPPAWLLDAVGLSALGMLAICAVMLDAYTPFLYRGGFALVALAAGAVIAAIVQPQARALPALLGGRGMRWIGRRSYGIYLWHWPVFTITRPHLDVPLDGAPLLAVRLMLTVGLAALSYRFVEAPARTGALGRAWQRVREARATPVRRFVVMSSIAACATGLIVAVVAATPAPPPAYLAVSAVHSTSPPRPTIVRAASVIRTSTPEAPATLAAIAIVTPLSATITDTATAATVASTLPMPSTPSARTPSGITMFAATMVDTASVIAMANAPLTAMATTESPAVITPTLVPTATATMMPAPVLSESVPVPESPSSHDGVAAALVPPTPHVFAIGDSVMVGAAPALQETFADIEIDAAVSRQASTAIDILRTRRDAGQLGDVVIVHMGTNGTFTTPEFDKMMQTLAGVSRVVFVNLKVPRPWEAADNAVIAAGVARYPNATLVDWHTAGTNHPEYFWDDGIHLRPDGAQAYANMIATALTP